MATKSKQRVRKSAIKKWEQTYTVPISYFGLLELNARNDRFMQAPGEAYEEYRGTMEKVFEGIPITVGAFVTAKVSTIDIANEDAVYDIRYDNFERRKLSPEDTEILDMYAYNNAGATQAKYWFEIWYNDPSSDGNGYIIGKKADKDYDSMEDVLDAITQTSEDIFPKIMEYINQEKMASTKKSKQDHRRSMKKSLTKRYYGDESDPDWDSDLERWKLGGDTHVKVYQISGRKINDLPEDDPEYIYFIKHKFRDNKEGLDLSYYDQQWEGDLNVHGDLDDLYGMLQDYRPIETSRTIYSLSVGDLIEMNGKLYMVDSFGFSEITDIKRSTKKSKMKKDLDVEGRFDDYRQEPHGKYVLHLNLNGDSFYPKYYDDEESFNRDVQSAIDGGYTESEHSNYSDSEGLHRRFWKDTWSTKKSRQAQPKSFNAMVKSIRAKNNKKKV